MARCPECGGNMVSQNKRKVCESCGLSLAGWEYDKLWDDLRDQAEETDEARKRRQREYLNWYQSSKK